MLRNVKIKESLGNGVENGIYINAVLLKWHLYKCRFIKVAFINGGLVILSYVKSLILKKKVKLLILKGN